MKDTGKKRKDNEVRPVLTKVSEEKYRQLVDLQNKLGYKSIYDLLRGLIYLELRCITDYPVFHGGKELERFEDLEDMLEMYQYNRIEERE